MKLLIANVCILFFMTVTVSADSLNSDQPLTQDAPSNEPRHNIFNLMFESKCRSNEDLIEILDGAPTSVFIEEPYNFTANNSQQIKYLDIKAEQIAQPAEESELEYLLGDYYSIKLRTVPNTIQINGRFEMEANNSEKILGNFTISYDDPVFWQTNSTNHTFEIEQNNELIQVSVNSRSKYYSSVSQGLDFIIKNLTSRIFHKESEIIQNKINQFGKAFPFLTDVINLQQLDNKYTFIETSPNSKKPPEYFHLGLKLVSLEGLNNSTYIKIGVQKTKHFSEETIAYNITIKTGELQGQCEWFYRNNQQELTRKPCQFLAKNLTLSISVLPSRADIVVNFDSIQSSLINGTCVNDAGQYVESFLSWELGKKLKNYFKEFLERGYRYSAP